VTDIHALVYVPGLLTRVRGHSAEQQCRGMKAPGLEKLLAYSNIDDTTADPAYGGYENVSARHFFGDQESFALAKMALAGEQNSGRDGFWMRADPVRLVADRDQLVMAGQWGLDITSREVADIMESLNHFYQDQQWQFTAPHPLRWYMRIPQPVHLHTSPLSLVTGKPIDAWLPQGEHATQFHAVLNEIQMLLHQHPVNIARENAGMPVINSVWFWGQGDTVALPQRAWQGVWVEGDPSVAALERGFSHYADCPFNPVDAAWQWLQRAESGDHFVVINGFWRAHQMSDMRKWQRILIRADKEWFTPMLKELGKTLQTLTIATENRVIKFEKKDKPWSFWSGKRQIQPYL